MDNFTHTLTGLMLARVCSPAEKSVPRWPLLMMLAANVPDIDALAGFSGGAAYLDQHRWITHSFAYLPLMAVLPVIFVRFLSRGKPFPWLRAWGFALLAVFSHLMLDWTNAYGIRLLAPFSKQWFRMDTTHIVDPWILAALMLALGAPWLAKLVGSEIGARRTQPGPERGWAMFALAFLLVYDGGRFIAHERAMAQLSSRMYNEAAPDRVTALPHAVNPLRWTGVIEQAGSVTLVPVSLRAEFDPTAGRIYYRPGAEWAWAIESAKKNPSFQALARFSQLPFWKVALRGEPEGAVKVTLLDLRFGNPAEPGFAASGVVRPGGAIEEITLSFGNVTKAFR